MNSNTTNLRDIKKIRLERHWSQEQLAEMSGLSIRTIQRIENGENARDHVLSRFFSELMHQKLFVLL
jgi:transcriptional regulator with XRE-family HTH domain